jgi:hypothetical protein
MIQPLRRAHRIVIPLLALMAIVAAAYANARPRVSSAMTRLPEAIIKLTGPR